MQNKSKYEYYEGGNKKYKYHTGSTPKELKRAVKERAEDIVHTLVQLYAQQEELIITYTMKNGITYTTEKKYSKS